MLREQLHELAQLGIASDQRHQRFGNARATFGHSDRATTGDGRRVQGSVLSKDGRLQLPELVTRFEPELLTQDVATVLEDAQRVGLPTGAIQREHQQAAELFANGCAATSSSSWTITPW